MDLDDRVAHVVLAAEHLAHLEVLQETLELAELRLRLGTRLLFPLHRHLEVDAAVAGGVGQLAEAVERALERRALAQSLLRGLAVVPEVRRAALLG